MTLKRLAHFASIFVFFRRRVNPRHPYWLRRIFPAVLPLVLAVGAGAQQSSSAGGTATTLTGAFNALAGDSPFRTAILQGTVTVSGASGDTSGTIALAASAQKSSEIDLVLPTGNSREIRIATGVNHFRSWTGPDAVEYKTALTDLKLPHPAWFFPSFVLLSGIGSPNYWSSDLGTETWEGKTVDHIAIWESLPSDFAPAAALTARNQTQTDFYIDPTTFLPVAIVFHVHPDPQNSNEMVVPSTSTGNDISVQVNYSDYRAVQGRQVPFHLQVVQGTSPFMDIHISSVAVNGGEPANGAN